MLAVICFCYCCCLITRVRWLIRSGCFSANNKLLIKSGLSWIKQICLQRLWPLWCDSHLLVVCKKTINEKMANVLAQDIKFIRVSVFDFINPYIHWATLRCTRNWIQGTVSIKITLTLPLSRLRKIPITPSTLELLSQVVITSARIIQ